MFVLIGSNKWIKKSDVKMYQFNCCQWSKEVNTHVMLDLRFCLFFCMSFIFNTEFHVFNILYASKLTKQLLISLCTIAYPLDCDSSAFKMEGEKKEKKQGYHPHLTVMET